MGSVFWLRQIMLYDKDWEVCFIKNDVAARIKLHGYVCKYS